LPPQQSNPTDADIINRITDQVQQDYGVKPKPGNVPSPPEVRMTKQIVILGNEIVTLGNQFTRLENIVKTQSIKTDDVLKLITEPASSAKGGYLVAYWIVGVVVVLSILSLGLLLLVVVVIAIIRKARETING